MVNSTVTFRCKTVEKARYNLDGKLLNCDGLVITYGSIGSQPRIQRLLLSKDLVKKLPGHMKIT